MAETAGQRTSEAQAGRPRGLSAGNWIAIGTVVLGGVVGFGLSEHNARLTSVDTNTKAIAASQTALAASQATLATSQARLEGEIKTVNERLNGIEQRLDDRFDSISQRFDSISQRLDRLDANIDRLLQLHIGSASEPPPAALPD